MVEKKYVKRHYIWPVALVLLFVVLAILSLSPRTGTLRPTGTIFITSSDDPNAPALQTYALHFDTGTSTFVGSDAASIGTMYSFSPDHSKVAFIGVTKDRIDQVVAQKIPVGQAMQVYSAQSGSIGTVPLAGASEQVTNNAESGKSAPAIADDGDILYVTSAVDGSQKLSDYTLHLVSGASPDRTIAHGAIQPRWLSDDVFYYIGNDGVRLASAKSSATILVLPISGQTNFKISISPDRHILAFSNPDAHKVFFFSIGHGGVTLAPLKDISILGFWTVFSPDGRLVAVQTAQGGTHPSLSFYDTSSFTHVGDFPLDPLLNDRLFVTAWQ